MHQLIHAHVAVTDAGFVAVDLYDGCLLYEFERRKLSLIDLDMYRPGPFILDADRQYGSSAYMAPEEWQRGATIDERTTVFTLARFALVLLGCARRGLPDRDDFRGSDRLFEIATRACAIDPAGRFGSVAELYRAWNEGIQLESRTRGASARHVPSADDLPGRRGNLPPARDQEEGEGGVVG